MRDLILRTPLTKCPCPQQRSLFRRRRDKLIERGPIGRRIAQRSCPATYPERPGLAPARREIELDLFPRVGGVPPRNRLSRQCDLSVCIRVLRPERHADFETIIT